MNLKLPVNITRNDFENLIEYHRQCGFEVDVKESLDTISVISSCPGYEITPVAGGAYDLTTRRWKLWMYIRLPDKNLVE